MRDLGLGTFSNRRLPAPAPALAHGYASGKAELTFVRTDAAQFRRLPSFLRRRWTAAGLIQIANPSPDAQAGSTTSRAGHITPWSSLAP